VSVAGQGDVLSALQWLGEAGAYAFQREDPEASLLIDLLIGSSTVGAYVTRGDRQQFKSLTWTELERAKSNPLLKLIDETVAGKSR
jgi:hypothetical protein